MTFMNKSPLPGVETMDRQWHIVDATNQRLGRLACVVANLLRGKHKATFTPHLDAGDFVIVINAEKVVVTGKKESQKVYRRHSGRPGGMKMETLAQLRRRLPERVVEHAVKGMLPDGRLGRRLFTKLKVYAGAEHPHAAQQPKVYALNTIPGERA